MLDQFIEFLVQNLQAIVLSLNLACVFLIFAVVISHFRRSGKSEELVLELAEEHIEYLKTHQGDNPGSNQGGKSKKELDRFHSRAENRGRQK